MTQQLLLTYFLNQKDIFLQNYKTTVRTADIDAIHDMRVSLKRLNTLVRMLNFSKRANFRLKNSIKLLRVIFKETGKIRDYQVFGELLTAYQNENQLDNTQLIAACNNSERKFTNLLYQDIQISDYQRLKRMFNGIQYHINSKDSEELELQFNLFKKECELRMKRFSVPSNEIYNLHSTRKAIKDLGYLQEMLLESNATNDEKLLKYKELGRLLGEWHDKSILYNYLILKVDKLFSGIIHFDELLNKLKSEKEELRNIFHSLSS